MSAFVSKFDFFYQLTLYQILVFPFSSLFHISEVDCNNLICTLEYFPICDSNGDTHSNRCNFDHAAACRDPEDGIITIFKLGEACKYFKCFPFIYYFSKSEAYCKQVVWFQLYSAVEDGIYSPIWYLRKQNTSLFVFMHASYEQSSPQRIVIFDWRHPYQGPFRLVWYYTHITIFPAYSK